MKYRLLYEIESLFFFAYENKFFKFKNEIVIKYDKTLPFKRKKKKYFVVNKTNTLHKRFMM
jgi:hypothetical protein